MAKNPKAPQPQRRGPLVILGDGLLLVCALTGSLLSFLSLYGDSGNELLSSVRFHPLAQVVLQHSNPQLVGLAVFFAMLSLLVWSLPRFRRPALALLGLGWIGLVWLIRRDVWCGAQLTAKTIADLFDARVGWFGTLELGLDLTTAQELIATERFLFAAVILLAFLLGWAIVRVRRWWLVVLITLPPLLPGLLADIYPNWPAFLMLAACWCTMLLTSLCRWAAPSGRGKLTLVTLPAVGLLLALISVLFPLEGYQRPQWTYAAEDAFVDFGNRHLPFLSELEGPFASHVTYVGSAEAINLTNAGPLNFTGRNVLKVSSEDFTGTLYLRGTSQAQYSDNRWETLDGDVYREYTDLLGGNAPFPLTFISSVAAAEKVYTITVENTGASGACAYAPYYLTDQNWTEAGLLPVADAYLARKQGQWSHTFTYIQDLSRADSSSASAALALYNEFAVEHYLDVPDELRDPLLALMGGRINGLTPVEAAAHIADYLASTCRYDPDTPAVPEGEDFVTYFLTESQRGYCMHFASAATLMLRCLDIPARYVSGFTADVTAGKTTYVPDSASHAWVEIYLEGYGWVPVDVTPDYVEEEDVPSEPPSPPPSEEPAVTPELPIRNPEVSNSPAPSLTPSPSLSPEVSQPIREELPQQPEVFLTVLRTLAKALKWLALAAVAVILVWLGQYLPKRCRARRLSSTDTNRAVLDGYRYMTQLEKWGGTLPSGLVELAQKARFSQHTISQEEIQLVTSWFDAERSRLSSTLPYLKKLAFHYLWGWSSATKEESHDHP